jgi:hypothetical protein
MKYIDYGIEMLAFIFAAVLLIIWKDSLFTTLILQLFLAGLQILSSIVNLIVNWRNPVDFKKFKLYLAIACFYIVFLIAMEKVGLYIEENILSTVIWVVIPWLIGLWYFYIIDGAYRINFINKAAS